MIYLQCFVSTTNYGVSDGDIVPDYIRYSNSCRTGVRLQSSSNVVAISLVYYLKFDGCSGWNILDLVPKITSKAHDFDRVNISNVRHLGLTTKY